jgi:hypothetical protein
MKIELKKEYNSSGEIVYWIYVDGNYVDSSLTEEKALKRYDEIKANLLNKKEPQIIKSEDI